MPIYTYECPAGHRFESMEGFEACEVVCAVCREEYFSAGGTVPHINVMAKRVPSLPAPAQFKCSMPTYQRKKT